METLKVRSREEARLANERLYFSGSPCRNGHATTRYVSTGKCTECHRLAMQRYADRDPGAYAEVCARARRAYRKRHPTREGELYRERRRRDPAFDASERARYNALHRAWTRKNHDKKFAWNAEARARKLRATPPWLSDEHRAQMRAIYREAKARPGGPWDVDHIVPLQGENACGLHVPWNLQILPASENRRKRNKVPAS